MAERHGNRGAYLLRGATVRDLHAQGFLRHARFWRRTLVSEDVVVGAYAKAAGWDLKGFAAPGEVFGIAHYGLPFPPEELARGGYGIIHAIKNDPHFTEAQICEHFQRLMATSDVSS